MKQSLNIKDSTLNLHVCILTSSIDKKGGGPSRSVPILAKGLSECGCQVTLLFVESNDMNLHLLDGSNVKIKMLPRNYTKEQFERELITGKFDLVHCQGIWLPFYHYAVSILRKANIPYIMTPRGCLEPYCMHVKRFKKQLAMLLYQKKDLQMANCILATSQMEAHNVRNLGIYSPVAVIPNGIDITEYKCRGEIEKYSIKKQILFLSRIDPKKGIEYLIEAWKILKSQYRDWNVIIVGNGEESYILRLKTLISKYGLEECIRILPPAFGEDKYKLYCESSLFVLPTYSENFGMVIAEAMSCGVPVITTNGTPWHELNTKKLGWCIDLSLNNLIKSISEAIDLGQDRLFELGQLSSRHVYENYQYNEVANRMISVYKWVINGDSTQGDVDFNLILGG